MSEGRKVVRQIYIDIWPDFMSIAFAFVIIVGVFYFTGLELSFEKNGDTGIYMEFTKIE